MLFAVALAALLMLGALLFSAAHGLVLRRQLQNTADAAALAASNLLINEGGCSPAGSGGPPRSSVVTAATSAVAANLGGASVSVSVSCPTGYSNQAVRVVLTGASMSAFGNDGFATTARATAVNGQVSAPEYSVALLDPSNPAWGSQRNGCPSYLVNGGVTVTYEGSVMVNSTCTLSTSANGALKAQNNSFQMNMVNGATLRIGGEYSANTAGKINPAPVQNARPLLPDPLSGLIRPCSSADSGSGCLGSSATLPARSAANSGAGVCQGDNADPCILLPGTYTGGIHAGTGSNANTVLLRPGVYYLRGGGMSLKSGQARILAIPSAGTLSDTDARTRYDSSLTATQVGTNWQADCPPPPASSTCGVLIYNAPGAGGSWVTSGGSSDNLTNGAQGVIQLRGYRPSSDALGNGTTFASYRNLVIWQARLPEPSPTVVQPVIGMSGGACSVLSGTVYAPGAKVDFGGSSCGSGGGNDPVATLQFIVWDLTLSGSNNFFFAYRADSFATPTSYGLVE
ncbi:MAG TPA: pilus assembly protein TadG-related protein [Candidatus Limnocylindria bacterium]|nr:pilus assembly protein TadG-related protein [Candidatus Limnocylindria bacterium]